ncbi:hypothetical protein GE09DRAFT_1184548 [Coniochaeta sp. 2T2.1]|nr:hypothetical protein GE09DRAFT_1184548 [Coniochaeta sp. 2T2.1]
MSVPYSKVEPASPAVTSPSLLTIKVDNKTSALLPFQIFNAPPDNHGDQGTAYINTWGTAPEVDPLTGSAVFQITSQYYANYEKATLTSDAGSGSDWHLDIPDGGAPIFTQPDKGDSDAKGGFTINTLADTWVPSDYPNRFCGIGRGQPPRRRHGRGADLRARAAAEPEIPTDADAHLLDRLRVDQQRARGACPTWARPCGRIHRPRRDECRDGSDG